ncbi:MAG: hypothetical protein PHX02_00680 [Oscillospiraceae bacterium]|nr:hypothetical protein [Oscillospiraceae bacterium]
MADEKMAVSDIKKESMRLALSVFLWTIFAAVLNFIIYMSMTMIFTGMSTKTIGERIYEIDDDGNRSIVTEIYFNTQTTGESTTAATSAATSFAAGATTNTSGQTTSTSTATTTLPTNQVKESIRSEFPKGASLALDIVSQLFMLILFVSMIYTKLWERGDKDSNRVQYKHMVEDKLRGLKIGLVAAIPSFAFYLILVLSKLKIVAPEFFFIYRFLNITFIPLISRMAGAVLTADNIPWLSLFGIFMTLLVLPITSYAAYVLGYKNISLSEKIIYVDPNKRNKRRR